MAACIVEGCDKTSSARKMCDTHYQRWRSHGDPLVTLKPYGRHVKPRCTVENCQRLAVAKQLCGKHYQRWKKNGDPIVVRLDRERTPQERFWAKVDKNGPVPAHRPELGPCWLWTGGTAEGYGMFWLDGRQQHAHVVAHRWEYGEIPATRERDHLCRNRACCRPSHLEVVDHRTNVGRGESPHGINARKTHCPQGHPYDAANTYVNPKGARACRACGRDRTRAWLE